MAKPTTRNNVNSPKPPVEKALPVRDDVINEALVRGVRGGLGDTENARRLAEIERLRR